MKHVCIIDPGLLEDGGHHAALMESLISHVTDSGKYTYYSHKDISKTFITKSQDNSNVSVIPHFSSYFYENYHEGASKKLKGTQSYIRSLAIEYDYVFDSVFKNYNENPIVFFYPCLNWEHALALELALRWRKVPTSMITHKVCCMFCPKEIERSDMNPFYRMAFKGLASRENIQLYATDWETKDYYESLGIEILGIHPCYLLPWDNLERGTKSGQGKQKVLVYFGDAKDDKGFFSVADLAEKLALKHGDSVNFIIQFTMAWETPELVEQKNRIKRLGEKYSNITVFEEFWETEKLVEEFRQLDAIICTYDTKVYQYKSSGLAWLASFFNVPIILRGKCWLQRETERLGNVYDISDELQSTELNFDMKSNEADSTYKNAIFSNLTQWLLN